MPLNECLVIAISSILPRRDLKCRLIYRFHTPHGRAIASITSTADKAPQCHFTASNYRTLHLRRPTSYIESNMLSQANPPMFHLLRRKLLCSARSLDATHLLCCYALNATCVALLDATRLLCCYAHARLLCSMLLLCSCYTASSIRFLPQKFFLAFHVIFMTTSTLKCPTAP